MDRRIQQALDGELPVEQLTPAERAELAACEQLIREVVDHVPDPGAIPDVTGQVMWRIAHPPVDQPVGTGARLSWLTHPLRWLWQPRPVTVRPAWALAVMVLLVAALAGLPGRQPAPTATAFGSQTVDQLVQFRFGAAGVKDVALVGDFGGWKVRYRMEQVAPGVWTTSLPLEPGVYDYAFVVDGTRWVLDPLAPAVSDGFGGSNSRLSVLAPERRART